MALEYLKKLVTYVITRFSGPWIAEEPAETDDEKIFGLLASDIARRTGIFPGLVKNQLDKMVCLGNPLAMKFNESVRSGAYSTRSIAFGDLCNQVKSRIDLEFK